MTFAEAISRSYQEIQRSWTRLAESAFGDGAPSARDEMSRGEFTSAFISERDLSFPAPRERPRQPQG